MTLFVLLATLVLLALTGPVWGADSRDGRDWQPRDAGSRVDRHAR